MKLDFVKNTKRIIIAHFVNNGVRTLIPFFRKTIFMWVLGSEYLGLNSLFYSVLGMLMLAELGFGTAIVCYMYKPVADDDHDLLCAYLCFFRKIYRCVGSFIFIAGLCLLPFLRRLIHGNIPPDVNLHILYLMFLTNSAIGYFFFAYRGSILDAYHRNDIASYIGTISAIVEFVSACIVLFLTHNYYFYVITLIASTLLNNILVYIVTRIYFPTLVPAGNLPKKDIKCILSNVKAIFMHKIGAVVNSSSDNIVISAFLGLSAVGAYGIYAHISSSIAGITSGICYSMTGGFGNKIYTEAKEDNFKLLLKVNRLLICLIIWCSAMLLALYQPFIMIWTRKDPTLIRHFMTPLLMVILFYEKQSREPIRMFKTAASLWQQDRWKAIIASIVNLTMNIVFIQIFPDDFKLDGVILATIISDIIIQMPWESYAVFAAFFTRKEAFLYWRKQLLYFPLAIVVCGLTWVTANVISIEGVVGFAVKGIAATAVAFALLLAIFREDAVFVLKKTIHRNVK